MITFMADDQYSKAVCDQKHGDLERRMNSIEHVVNGNGKPGLATQIATLGERMNTSMWALGIGLGLLQLLAVVVNIVVQSRK